MRTVETISSVAFTARIALYVLPLSLSASGNIESPHVFVDDEAYWTTPEELSTWSILSTALMEWQSVVPSDVAGV